MHTGTSCRLQWTAWRDTCKLCSGCTGWARSPRGSQDREGSAEQEVQREQCEHETKESYKELIQIPLLLETTWWRDHLLFSTHTKTVEPQTTPQGLNSQVHGLYADVYQKKRKDSDQNPTMFCKHWKFRAPGWFSPAKGDFYSSLREIRWSQVFWLLCQIELFLKKSYCCLSSAKGYLLRKLLISCPKCCLPCCLVTYYTPV